MNAVSRKHALFVASILCAQIGGLARASAADQATAKLDKPIPLTVHSGSCESDGKGDVGANFGNALAFNIGPITAAMVAMSKPPYTGPGTYRKVIISGYPVKGTVFMGLGTVVVNPDRQTGTFATDDGHAAGSWDCGAPLK